MEHDARRLRARLDYWPNGNKKLEGQYLVAAEGLWRRWFEDGTLAEEVTLRAGVRHGPYRTYTTTGAVCLEGEFFDGERHGEWRCWSADGALIYTYEYNRGQAVKQTWGPQAAK